MFGDVVTRLAFLLIPWTYPRLFSTALSSFQPPLGGGLTLYNLERSSRVPVLALVFASRRGQASRRARWAIGGLGAGGVGTVVWRSGDEGGVRGGGRGGLGWGRVVSGRGRRWVPGGGRWFGGVGGRPVGSRRGRRVSGGSRWRRAGGRDGGLLRGRRR